MVGREIRIVRLFPPHYRNFRRRSIIDRHDLPYTRYADDRRGRYNV